MKTLDEVEPRIPIIQDDIPLTISTSGSYYLTSDVNSAGNAITIDVNNVTIDLMGYSLIGPGPGTSRGISLGIQSNVEVRNGTVRGFGWDGIFSSSGMSGAKGCRIINVRAVSNGWHGIEVGGYGHLVKDCTATENGTSGIKISAGCTVIGNTVFRNQFAGINAGSGCTVMSNTAYENNQSNTAGYGGIMAYYGCLIKANTARFNKLNNIALWGPINGHNAIEDNLVTDCTPGNGIGFFGTGNFYANNRASGNGTNYANTAGNTDGGGNASF
jgi:parallel beta-helix repeat protein